MIINIFDQFCNAILIAVTIAICLDETTDIKSSNRLAIIANFPKENKTHEELLNLTNIPERTTGIDCEVVVND